MVGIRDRNSQRVPENGRRLLKSYAVVPLIAPLLIGIPCEAHLWLSGHLARSNVRATAYRRPGAGGLPLALRLSEGLGGTFACAEGVVGDWRTGWRQVYPHRLA